jgi:hypothetical protein
VADRPGAGLASAPRAAPTLDAVLADPSASHTLKTVLQQWAARDPVDATHDAEILLRVLERRARLVLGGGG